jgi:hypothetical protein
VRRAWTVTAGLLLFMAALFVAGCGHPLIPSSAVSPTPTATVPAAHQTAPILGVDLYSDTGYKPATVRHDGALNLTYIKRALHAQSVGVMWNFYSPSNTSDAISQTNISLTPAEVATLTREAYRLGMSVEYRPVIRVGRHWTWEGHLVPQSEHAWFASLFSVEAPYLRLAQRLHVKAFVVGTELQNLAGSPDWPTFLAQVRALYHGTVTYASYDAEYATTQPILPPTGQYGVDAYPSVNVPDTGSVAQLTAAWDSYFGQVSPAVLAKTTIEEIGIPALDGAYQHPSVWTVKGHRNPLVQARWFTTACDVAFHYHMEGIYFYEINLTQNPAKAPKFPAFFEQTKGAQAIRACRTIFHT